MDHDQKAALIQRLLRGIPATNRVRSLARESSTQESSTEPVSRSELASMIDHTILGPDITLDQVSKACDEARRHGFAAVCVAPCYVDEAASRLEGSDVAICTVIGFPLGANHTSAKVFETEQALNDGATEIDMVINIGWLKSGLYRLVKHDVQSVVDRAREFKSNHVMVKAILETSLLTDEEKIAATLIAEYAGASFIKTSTGFTGAGASTSDIARMRRLLDPHTGIKASGGIHTFEQANAMIRAGATRIGASRSVAIIEA